MALKKIFTANGNAFIETQFGRVSNGTSQKDVDFYIKVSLVTASKDTAVAEILFSSEDVEFITSRSFTPNLNDASNFIAQAYDHLKTLPEFADAIDC